jgi:manganese efflux pump family protein
VRRPVVLLTALPAGLLAAGFAAGCSARAPAPYRATASTCYAFSVQALQRHITVTSVPRACAGLSHEQIDLAVTRAVRDVAGPHRKAIARRLAARELPYLAYLIQAVPVPAPATPAAAPAQAPAGSPLRLAALAAWIAAVLAGSWLIAGWLVHGGLRQRGPRVAGVPRAVVFGHAGLALTGLGIWIAFLVSGVSALAWAAVGVILSVAGLGMATLAGGLPEAAAGTGPAGPAPPAAVRTAGTEATAVREVSVEVRRPLARIAVHGVLAATAILLVVLAAAGS